MTLDEALARRMKFVQLVGNPGPVRHVFLMEEIIPRGERRGQPTSGEPQA